MESFHANSVGNPAQYGKACTNCARAKAKCVNANSSLSGKCERCHRLTKDCQRPTTIRVRKPASRKPTKVDRLEEKLDGLATLLRSTTQQSTPVDNQLTPDSLQSAGSNPKFIGDDQPTYALTTSLDRERVVRVCPGSGSSLNTPVLNPDTSYAVSGTRSSAFHSKSALSVRLEPSLDEAEECLDIFRGQMMQYSPFITMAAATTSQELRRERPFLWLCIMAISSKSTERQKALGREIRLTIGREIILEGKNNLDLLTGILTYTAWAHFHLYDKPIITQLMQLAMGLVANLGLRKLPPKEPPQLMMDLDSRGCPKPFNPSARTMEERRAGLWCWLVSSTVSCYFQKVEPLPWTPYNDECLRILSESREHSADMLLVQFVRLQLIVEKAVQAPRHDGLSDASSFISTPSQFYLKALEIKLQDFKQALPLELSDNKVLLLHTYSTEIMIHEIALMKLSTSSSGMDFQRLDSFYACLHAVKNWFDAFLVISPADYVGISMAVFTQMAHCIIALYRLSTLDYPGWDCGVVRNLANLSAILGQIIDNMAQVKSAAGLERENPEDKDVFSANSRRIDTIKTWWDSKVAAESNGLDAIVADEAMTEAPVDFWDDVWLQDVLGAGPYGYEPFEQ